MQSTKICRRSFIKAMVRGTTLSPFIPFMLKRKAWSKEGIRSRVVISRDDAATDGPNINCDVVRKMLRRAIAKLATCSGNTRPTAALSAGLLSVKIRSSLARKMTACTCFLLVQGLYYGPTTLKDPSDLLPSLLTGTYLSVLMICPCMQSISMVVAASGKSVPSARSAQHPLSHRRRSMLAMNPVSFTAWISVEA